MTDPEQSPDSNPGLFGVGLAMLCFALGVALGTVELAWRRVKRWGRG